VPLADELLGHASRLINASVVTDADCRRAVSASYYAVFHLLSNAVGTHVCPSNPPGMSGRFQHALDHKPMRNAMIPFGDSNRWMEFSNKIDVPCTFSPELAVIAQVFAELQDARHFADYDVVDAKRIVGLSWASNYLDKAQQAFDEWNLVKSTETGKLFLAALALGVNWTNRIK
jgi:hypothetical protein